MDAEVRRGDATDPRSVTIVMNSLHGGGAEHVGRTWARTLRQDGHVVTLVVLTRLSRSDRESFPDLADGVVELVGPRLRRYRQLRTLLRRTRSAACVSLQMRPNLLSILVWLTIPRAERSVLAVSERNIVSVFTGGTSLSHRIKVRLARRLYRYADRMVAISHPVAAEMIARFGVRPEKCVIVPNPAAIGPATPRRAASSGLDLPLVVVGRVVAQKRPLLAVEVAAILRQRRLGARLVVFGAGPLEDELRAAAEAAAVDVDWRGWVEDWPTQCPDGSVLLLTSLKEGFGNVLVEAATHGIPSVACSQALGVADALVPGLTGELALTSAAWDVADAVMRARECPMTGIDHWLSRFSPEESTRSLMHAVLPAGTGAE